MTMPETPDKANRPHYHVWILADGERAFFRRARGFFTRQAARQYGLRLRSKDDIMVRPCTNPRCAPKLD